MAGSSPRLVLTVLIALLLTLVQAAEAGPIDDYLALPFPAADGFDVPAEGGVVRAAGTGRVRSAKDGTIVIDHIYYENEKRIEAASSYSALERLDVTAGQIVERGAVIGHSKKLVFESRELKRRYFVPHDEPVLTLIDAENFELRIYRGGRLQLQREVGFGQAKGQKRRRGDNKTPRGMYFVTEKYRGEFSGEYGEYYGGHWIKINYPNEHDAAWGLAQGLITPAQASSIGELWRARRLTAQKTRLGGGIGLHGWAFEWALDREGGHLSWGCVVAHLKDIREIFDALPIGTMVVIL